MVGEVTLVTEKISNWNLMPQTLLTPDLDYHTVLGLLEALSIQLRTGGNIFERAPN